MLAHLASRLLSARSALLRVFRVSDWQITLLWAVVAGLAGAAATEGFRLLLDGVSTLVFGPHTGMVDIARRLFEDGLRTVITVLRSFRVAACRTLSLIFLCRDSRRSFRPRWGRCRS